MTFTKSTVLLFITKSYSLVKSNPPLALLCATIAVSLATINTIMAEQNPLRKDGPISFFSRDYKNRVTQSSIHKAFRDRLLSEEDYPDDRYPAYKAPPYAKRMRLPSFFTLYRVNLRRAAPLLFKNLRREYYHINETIYQNQLTKTFAPVSGLGFSGSLFYVTDDKSYLIKSVGRNFEYTFLIEHMLDAQAEHTERNGGKTLLNELCDVLFCFDRRIGGILNLSPSHYVVMTNMLRDQDAKNIQKWDLKPQTFFEPNRDIVPEVLQTESARTGLSDELDTRILLTRSRADELRATLERDTDFLRDMGVIDYSILLGRYSVEGSDKPPQPERFSTGVTSGDGEWVYMMCIVDYLWNADKKQAKLVKTANSVFPEQTITTSPGRYKEEFMKMMSDYVSVVPGAEPA